MPEMKKEVDEKAPDNSYKTRGRAAPNNHTVYSAYQSALGLDDACYASLKKRGLTPDQIVQAKYATKPTNRSKKCGDALAKLRGEKLKLDEVPGFYTDDKTEHWTQSHIYGTMIPVRDIEGNIASIVVRNANPKMKAGKAQNKYVAFSSAGKNKGSKVWQTTHCPIIKGDAKDVATTDLMITEGVLKADVATALGDMYCVGLQGLKVHDDLEIVMEDLETSTGYIALDSGEDGNPDMIMGKGELIRRCLAHGVDVKVCKWDPKLGKGIDDVLKNGHWDKVTFATDQEVDDMLEEANAKDPNNGEWIYCIASERFVSIYDFTMLKKGQFADMFHFRQAQDIADLLAGGFPQVYQMTYYPSQPRIFYEGGRKCLNLWKDPEIEAMKGDITPLLNHLDYLFPLRDSEREKGMKHSNEVNILLDYFAYMVQKPGEKVNWTPLIKGEEGVGKSILETVMRVTLGQENVREVTNEEMHEKYNPYMKAAQLVVVHEMMSAGRLEMMNKLKPLITQDTVQIREMFCPVYTQPNRTNFLLFTNYESAVIISAGDRRYCVMWTDVPVYGGGDEKAEKAYYDKLWDFVKGEDTAAALKHFFMERDLSKFNAKGRAPTTESKAKQHDASRTNLEAWICDSIADEVWPFNGDVVCIRHLKDPRVCKRGMDGLSDNKWASALKEGGAVQYKSQVKLSDGSKARLWVVRNQEVHMNEMNHESVGAYLGKKFEASNLDSEPSGNPLADAAPM